MLSFRDCSRGTRVVWNPTNDRKARYIGRVVAHNRSGKDIYLIRGYEKKKAGKARSVVSFDRVVVKAEHDNHWHAQDIRSLKLAPS
jgi:hypothetical protein